MAGVALVLTGVIEAVAEQEKLALVAEANALAHESEEILERTADEQIARGQEALAVGGVTAGSIGKEAPNPAGMFNFAEGEGKALMWRGADGLMREALWVASTAPANLKGRILKLLQVDEAEGGRLAGAPEACRMAWASLRERDAIIADLDVRVAELDAMVRDLSSALEGISAAAGARPAEIDLATHVKNLVLSAQFGAQDGYTKAFYQIAEVLGIAAQPRSPREVFESQIFPEIQMLVRFKKQEANRKRAVLLTDETLVTHFGDALDPKSHGFGLADMQHASHVVIAIGGVVKVVKARGTAGEWVMHGHGPVRDEIDAAFDEEERKALRDAIAIRAMEALIGRSELSEVPAVVATESYAIADEMLLARG